MLRSLARQHVKNAPEFHSSTGPERSQELGIYWHHGRPFQWVAEAQDARKRVPAKTPG